MYWQQRSPNSLGIRPSPVRYAVIAREQQRVIAPPIVSRYGLTRQQLGMVGRGGP